MNDRSGLQRLRDITTNPALDPLAEVIEASNFARILWYIAPDAVLVSGEDGIVFLVNPAAEAILGYRAGDLVGHSVSLFLSPESRVRYDSHLQACLAASHGGAMEAVLRVEILRRDGTEQTAELRAIPLSMPERTIVITMLKEQRDASGSE